MLILQKCHHPNIIQLLEIIDDPQCRKLYMGKAVRTGENK